MADVEKPQPMEIDSKKPDEKAEEKPEMVSEHFFVESLSNELSNLWCNLRKM